MENESSNASFFHPTELNFNYWQNILGISIRMRLIFVRVVNFLPHKFPQRDCGVERERMVDE